MRALRLVAVAILALDLSPRASAGEGVGVAPAFAIRGRATRRWSGSTPSPASVRSSGPCKAAQSRFALLSLARLPRWV